MQDSQRLVVEKLSKSYNSNLVVDSLSFTLEPGEILGLLGSNGAGKTTTVSMLYGAVIADSGSTKLMPSGVDSFSAEAMRSIGVVAQYNSLDPDFDLRMNLALFARYHGLPKQIIDTRVIKLLKQFALEDYANHRVEQLSGGLLRRAVLARSIIANPQFIFLDEPTTGFDPDVRQLFWRSILSLKDEGKSILLTTHYMDEAQRLCDRILLLENGKVIDTGTPSELIKRWIGTNVVEVEGVTENQLQKLYPDSQLLTFARGFIAAVDSSGSENYLRLEQLGATQIQFRKATLDDVFLALQERRLGSGERHL